VIDDQKALRDALGEMLSVFGFTVETYPSADEFLAAPRLQLAASWPTWASRRH
jgi:FixJ family two-component response regulator